MKTTINPYSILGIPRDASQTDVKRAYRRAALQNHPDRNRDRPNQAEAKMAMINEAYSIVKDEERRRHYDHLYKYGGIDEDDDNYDNGHGHVKTQDGGGLQFHVPRGIDPFAYIPAPRQRQSGSYSFSSSMSSQRKNKKGESIYIRKATQYQNGWKETHIETATVNLDGQTTYKNETKREKTDLQNVKDFFSSLLKKKSNSNGRGSTNSHGPDTETLGERRWIDGILDQVLKCTDACGAKMSLGKR
jgi:curved DNA-binding protein CbpA